MHRHWIDYTQCIGFLTSPHVMIDDAANQKVRRSGLRGTGCLTRHSLGGRESQTLDWFGADVRVDFDEVNVYGHNEERSRTWRSA